MFLLSALSKLIIRIIVMMMIIRMIVLIIIVKMIFSILNSNSFFYKQLESALKVAYVFKVFRAQSCLMVA